MEKHPLYSNDIWHNQELWVRKNCSTMAYFLFAFKLTDLALISNISNEKFSDIVSSQYSCEDQAQSPIGDDVFSHMIKGEILINPIMPIQLSDRLFLNYFFEKLGHPIQSNITSYGKRILSGVFLWNKLSKNDLLLPDVADSSNQVSMGIGIYVECGYSMSTGDFDKKGIRALNAAGLKIHSRFYLNEKIK